MDQSERMDQPDLVNPSRGYYRWRSQEIVPNEPALDAYDRYFWSDIETSKGDYDFSIIDTAIAEAAARGQKFGFRIRAMKDSSSGGMYIPSYLKDCGWYNSDTFIPDWNSGCFLDNAENMIRAWASVMIMIPGSPGLTSACTAPGVSGLYLTAFTIKPPLALTQPQTKA